MSRPFFELPAEVRGQILLRIANYDSFDNNGYHDAGVLILNECSVCWRIEHRKEGLVLDVSFGTISERLVRKLFGTRTSF